MTCSAKTPKLSRRSSEFRVAVHAQDPGAGHDEFSDCDAEKRQPDHEPEDALDADDAGENRSGDQRHHEGHSDGDAHQGHGARAVFLGSQIRHQRQDDRADRGGSLQRPANNDSVDRGRNGGHGAANREHDQSQNDHGFSADLVGQETEWDLQQSLAQAIDTERKPGFSRCRTREMAGIVGKNRIDHEQAQQPHGEDGRQREGGAKFLLIHTLLISQ